MAIPSRPTFLEARQYEALALDTLTSEHIRIQIMEAAAKARTSEEAQKAVDEACKAHLFQGARVTDIHEKEVIGHLIFVGALLRRIADLIGEYDVDRANAVLLVLGERIIVEESVPVVHDFIDSPKYQGEWIKVDPDGRPRVIWIFRRDDLAIGRNAFEGIGDGCLPWRLGLPNLEPGAGTPYVGLALNGGNVAATARLPRSPDAGYDCLKYWRPGGRSVPRTDMPAACAGGTGLRAPRKIAACPELCESDG